MKRSIILSIILVAVLGFTGCMKRNCGCDPDPKPEYNPPILFQYEYYNYAWGFRHHGFLIDQDGRVNGFEQPKKWMQPDSAGMMGREDLEFNLRQCDTLCGKVDKELLNDNFKKIEDIRFGKIEDTGIYMADAGTGVISAWYWNKRAEKYENVFLWKSRIPFQTSVLF